MSTPKPYPATCPIDGEPLSEDGNCPVCTVLGSTEAGASGNDGSGEQNAYVPGPMAAPPSPTVAPAIEEPTTTEADEGKRSTGPQSTRDTQPKSDQGGNREAAAGYSDSETATFVDALEAFDRELEQVRKHGLFTITLIGHSAAGKSFLLNRLKYELSTGEHGFYAEPPFVQTLEKIERTTVPTMHWFERNRDRSRFAIADIPGDYLPFFLAGNYVRSAPILDAIMRSSALVLAMPADAVVLGEALKLLLHDKNIALGPPRNGVPTVPAASRAMFQSLPGCETLDNKEINAAIKLAHAIADEHDKLNAFQNGIKSLAIAAAYLKANELAADEAGIKAAQLTPKKLADFRHGDIPPLGGPSGIGLPVFVALTKADVHLPFFRTVGELVPVDSKTNAAISGKDAALLARLGNAGLKILLDLLDNHRDDRELFGNPRELVRIHRSQLLSILDNWMPMNRFDLVTAYYGQPPTDMIDNRQHSFGVDRIIQWFNTAHRLRQRSDLVLARKRSWRPDPINSGSLQRAQAVRAAMTPGSARFKNLQFLRNL